MTRRTDPGLKAIVMWASLLFGLLFWMMVAGLIGALAGWIMKSF